MTRTNDPHRAALAADAAGCALMGLAALALAEPLSEALSLPAALLRGAGVLLLPVAGFIAYAVRIVPAPQPLLRLIVVGNALWVAASLVLLASGLVEPNALGIAFVLAQAAGVALLTAIEATGLRRRQTARQ